MSLGWLKQKTHSSQAAPAASEAPSDGVAMSVSALEGELRKLESDLGSNAIGSAQERALRLYASHPDNPQVLLNLGICRYLNGQVEEAARHLLEVVKADSNNGRAQKFLAASLERMGDHVSAIDFARRAMVLLPPDVELLSLAANASTQLGAFGDAAQFVNRALELQPDSVDLLHRLEIISKNSTLDRRVYEASPRVPAARRRAVNRLLAANRKKRLGEADLIALLRLLEGVPEKFPIAIEIARASTQFAPMTMLLSEQLASIFMVAGDGERMMPLVEHCFALEPTNDLVQISLSQAWLMMGRENWVSAWRMMTNAFYRSRPFIHPQEVPLWDGRRLGNGKVLVYQDQGVGDAVLAFRFLPMLVARGVAFELWVRPAVADLVAMIPGCELVIRTPERPAPDAHGCQYATPLFGLITALQIAAEDIRRPPVVRAGPQRAQAIRKRIAALPGLRVGLIVGGNPMRRDDWLRSLPVESLGGIAAIRGISWVNLMIDDRPDKSKLFANFRITDPMPDIKDFADTAAVIEELDAVVAVDSSVAHIAANLGKTLWVLAPSSLDWRWQMGEEESPWWPGVRLIRSEAPGKWTRAIAELSVELNRFVSTHAFPHASSEIE